MNQPWTVRVLLAVTSVLVADCLGCADPNPSSGTKKSPASPAKGNPTVFKQAIDRAKGLEKEINDRAMDPGEKARLGGDDPLLLPPDGKAADGG